MKKAVMYGAGNIGRGFIGALFSRSGYHVTFIDVATPVVEALNREHCYPVRIIDGESRVDLEIAPVAAIHGQDSEAVAQAIAEADILATAVGVNVLKLIVPNLIAGIRRRLATSAKPLNIIICENLLDADRYLAGLIEAGLNAEEQQAFRSQIGLVEASIGRMVPVQTPDMQDGNPLRVCVEPYSFLPVDRAAFKGEIPVIENLVPYEPFGFYIKRKLFVHNMGHALCAYLGGLNGLELISDAIDNADILVMAENAMLESAQALASAYHVPVTDLLQHIQDLLHRFTNRALRDTCARVGADPRRKLAPADRLVGAARLCRQQGVPPVFIAVGIACAIDLYLIENHQIRDITQAEQVLREISEIDPDEQVGQLVLAFYEEIVSGSSLADLRRLAGRLRAAGLHNMII
ncbi:MAG TPA: mannitol dehydrogenase [Clostridiales bacterium]|nr:mannitol dehydrogenase [Clostridiales bacterium]